MMNRRLIEADGNVVSLHPMVIDQFAANIDAMHSALTGELNPEAIAPFAAAFRNVFDRIVVHPTKKRAPYEVTPYARLSAIMGVELFPKVRSAEEMLAEQGLAYCDNGNDELSQILPYRSAKIAIKDGISPAHCQKKRPLAVDSPGLVTRNRQ